MQFDIADRARTRGVLEEDMARSGVYYGVICNAGVAADNAFPSITDDEWDRVIHTNLDGFYNVLLPVIMPMVRAKKPGRIITLSSVSGIVGNRGQVNYSAAKAGIIGATKALAVEMGKREITVNCIAPGVIDTEMSADVAWEHILPTVPLRRMGKPEEVAGLAVFLLSESAAYITRQVISVNGGMV
jgi:3-oxoacyl-[acyl-carrier protein] reductase